MNIKRIIPCLDIYKGRVVKGVNFENIKDVADPVEVADFYNKAGADELTFLDITATSEGRGTMLDMVEKVANNISIPFTVGGGIRTVKDMQQIIKAGADKISINSAAIKRPQLILEGASDFGSQSIVVAIDAKKRSDGSGWEVYINGGKVNTGKDALEWAIQVEKMGGGEILLTSMDMDGTKKGYDIELTRQVSNSVNIPVIASGGAGSMEDFYEVLTLGGADAVLAASLFHFRQIEILDLKRYIRQKGVQVRI
jgi:cyclase